MKNEAFVFMDLLQSYFTEYMPYTAGLSENTIRSYKYTFQLLFKYLHTEKKLPAEKVCFRLLDYDTIMGFLHWLETERRCAVSTRNQRLNSLSSFAEYAGTRNFEAVSVFMNSVKKIPAKKSLVKPRTIFTVDEVACLLRTPDTATELGRRDQMILSLMYASGARAQEICDLRVRDVSFQREATRLVLTGKGNKARRIIIAKPCAENLKKYIQWRGLTNQLEHHLFSSRTHEHMTVVCIEELFRKYIHLARSQNPTMFLEEKYTPHTMRHTCATHMLEAGVPIIAIKNFLGHASVMTTERYADLSQSTVNRHIREWNDKWFREITPAPESKPVEARIPDFLR